MTFPETSIENLRGLGYTEDEARFLYLVAMHSGYFTTRQFLAFTGTRSGDRSMAFTQKVLGHSHATARLLLRNGRVYHLFSRIVYRALGRENLRNRREHAADHIRSRLMILDFVLAHLDYTYLETEQDKIRYFVGQMSIPKQSLPTKRYTGAINKHATDRYFVDKFPIFFGPHSSVVNFTFIDPGWDSLKTLDNHLFAYMGLFGALREVHLTYVATRPTRFKAAQEMFLSMVDRPPKTDPSEEVLRYFRLRKAWEEKKYALFANEDIELLNKYTQQFAKHPCAERYPAWKDGQVSTDMIRSLCRDMTPPRNVSFHTELVDGQAALFEAKSGRKTNDETHAKVKTAGSSTFRPPFSSAFTGEQKELSEK